MILISYDIIHSSSLARLDIKIDYLPLNLPTPLGKKCYRDHSLTGNLKRFHKIIHYHHKNR